MWTLAWLGMAAYAMHILEEYVDWRNWAHNVLGLPAEWNDFYVTNSVVVALGIAQAMLTTNAPPWCFELRRPGVHQRCIDARHTLRSNQRPVLARSGLGRFPFPAA